MAPAGTEIGRWCSWEGTLARNTASMFRESVILVTLVAGIAARFVRSYPPRQEALTRCLAFAGFQLQVVYLMGELLFWRQSMHDQRDRGGWVRRVVVDRMATP